DEIHVLMHLGARTQHARRHAPRRWNHNPHAIAIELGALLVRQRYAVDDHVSLHVLPAFVADRVDAAADALADPVILVLAEQVPVAIEHVLADLDHLRRLEPAVDPGVAQRAVEPVDVLLDLEDAPVEGAGHVEHAVALRKAAVAEGNHHLALRNDLAVEIGDALIGECAHGSLSRLTGVERRPASKRYFLAVSLAFLKARSLPSPSHES